MSEIFRKKSLDKVSSPEQLNDYIRVTSPSVWIILASVVVLLVGVCVWGVFGRMDTTISGAAQCEGGTLTCYVPAESIREIPDNATITVDGKSFAVAAVNQTPVRAGDAASDYVRYLGAWGAEDFLCTLEALTDLPDGEYRAEVVVESVAPISFAVN